MMQGFSGRIAQYPKEKRLLATLCRDIDLYVEIGTLWGGTAIIAGLAGAKKVITIDKMDTLFWKEGDPAYPDEKLSKERVLQNIREFGLEEVVEVIQAPSNPNPLRAGLYPNVLLIDGGHSEKEVEGDWINFHSITKEYILFHDYNRCPGVTNFVDSLRSGPNITYAWVLDEIVEVTAVFRRIA